MRQNHKPPVPAHVPGTSRGEERALKTKEPGRGDAKQYRSSRDSTGINSQIEKPIHPAMPSIPPA